MLHEVIPTAIPSLAEVAVSITAPIEPGPADIIPGLLPRRGQLVIAGETNVGKSLLALEIASCLSTGEPLWGELEPAFRAKRILYVLGEHYREVIQRLWQHTRLPMSSEVYIIGPEELMYDKWLVSRGQPNVLAVKKFQRWCEKVDLIIFDPLASFVNGFDTENDNIAMRLVLDTMSLIAQTTGAACLVLAHQGKPTVDFTGREHSRKSYAIRGASAIEDAATNIFYMGKSDTGGKSASVYELKCRKYKGLAPDEYRLLRDPATLRHTLLGHKPLSDVLRSETQAKVSRIQIGSPMIDFRTAVKLVADMEGVALDTMYRRLGINS